MPDTSHLHDQAVRLREAMAGLAVSGAARGELSRQLLDVAERLEVQAYVGTIAAVGQFTVGYLYVEFIDSATSGGYASEWPQWAFEIAQTALVAGKDVVVFADGDPIGSNLISVWILA